MKLRKAEDMENLKRVAEMIGSSLEVVCSMSDQERNELLQVLQECTLQDTPKEKGTSRKRPRIDVDLTEVEDLREKVKKLEEDNQHLRVFKEEKKNMEEEKKNVEEEKKNVEGGRRTAE